MKIEFEDLNWSEANEKKHEWDKLLIGSSFPNPFTSLPFYNAWIDTFINDTDSIRCIFFYDDKKLIGIAPLWINDKNKIVSILGDKDLFDYRDIIINSEYESEIYSILFHSVLESKSYEGYKFIFESIPENSKLLDFVGTSDLNDLEINTTEEDVTPNINLPTNWDDYLISLKKKQRHEVRRKLRKFESENFTSQIITDKSQLDEFKSQFFDLFVKSRADKEEFLPPDRKSFFTKLLLNFANESQLRILCLYDNSELISACIVFDYNETYFLYNNAYSLMYNSFSVGLISKIYAIKESIEKNKTNFNFLRGDERYKYHLGGEEFKIYTVEIN